MKTLSTEDAIFLYIETRDQHQHTVATLILNPTDSPQPFSTEALIERLEVDLAGHQAFSRKLVKTPFSMTPPVLVEDPHYAYRNHVHQVAVPAPGGRRELDRLVADIASTRLSQRRPLWECWFVSGLEGGRIAIIFKSHHCLADAISGVALMSEVFDREARTEAPDPGGEPRRTASRPPLWDITWQAIADQWRYQPRYHQVMARTMRSLQRRHRLLSGPDALGRWVPSLLEEAPRLKFNAPLSSARAVATGSLPLDQVSFIRTALDLTVNDVVSAACTLALRDYLIATDDLPERPLICTMPVSLALRGRPTRKPDQSNHVGTMAVRLPVQLEDPAQLVAALVKSTHAAKQVFEESYDNLLQTYIGAVPPSLADWALKQALSRQVMKHAPTGSNLMISCFPGPDETLYLNGAQLESTYCMGPLISGQGPNLTFVSYGGEIHFTVQACREHLPDVDSLARGITRGFDTLAGLAGRAVHCDAGPGSEPAEETSPAPAFAERQPAEAPKDPGQEPARPRIVVRDVITV